MSNGRPFIDRFSDPRRRGCVIGSQTSDGTVRGGIDVEGVMSVDNGALRIQPLIRAGWNRASLSYGPFSRQSGLVFCVSMLNGHNTSQAEQLPDSFRQRMYRWLVGSESDGVGRRMSRWIITGRVARALRAFRWWARTAPGRAPIERLDENLAVGWFPRKMTDRLDQGSAIVMHATGPENGELWRNVGGAHVPAVRGVQNLHIYYIIALREDSAVYYASSVQGAHGLAPYPLMRPLGIDTSTSGSEVWACIHQGVLGQIGFRLDTRVYSACVTHAKPWRSRFGGAHAADDFTGSGFLAGSADVQGRTWIDLGGHLIRTRQGATPGDQYGASVIQPDATSGLIRARFSCLACHGSAASLWWRVRDAANGLELKLSDRGTELVAHISGERQVVAVDDESLPDECEIQILDDGQRVTISIGGNLAFGRTLVEPRLSEEVGIAIALEGVGESKPRAELVEAHPRRVEMLDTMGFAPPWFRQGEQVVVFDDFSGEKGPLEETVTTLGKKIWKRVHGVGEFERSGSGFVRIVASNQSPCPGRTMYCIEWDKLGFVDLEVTITPPGTERGHREHGSAGFVIWQDKDNYITVNSWLSDSYGGASISCFFKIRGWEDLYDAIWSNVGSKIRHGNPFRLRLVFDGLRYMVFVDDEPVVFRSLTDVYEDCEPLSIRRVGLIANWEWGLDTGSEFRSFRARI